ncbi:hypothetical protein [Flavobacterium laiguense]|uniref:Uncharacterized protein n=1 Tax=Flavobacterium laiguense TaxID=2169409 RepID=A0A2U1K336_9FLAO|nr:hypothetical protein [Flavobacterium laiguense]PWA11559.1 hypothetical protein DB891_01765 [Flavobacterium laiguense]
MKRNVFLKAYLTNGLALILVFFLSNCQVEEDTLQGNNKAVSEIYKVKIEDYWGQLKTGSSKEQLAKIEELSTAIDINSLKIYDLRTTEKLVIANAKSLQGLDGIIKIIFYINENKVVRSNIVTLKTNEANSDYDKVIQSVLNADKNGFNYTGEITFLSLSKTKLLYDKFNQGNLIENKTLSSARNRKKFSKTQGNCTEYWWVTKYGNEIISQVYMFTVCDCSGGGGPNGGDETFKMSNCDNGAGVFLGGSSASTSTNKPTLPANPINNQTYKFTDPDGVCTEYIYKSSINSWHILEVILPNIIISRNKDNYGILDFQWPVDNQKVFDPSTNIFYTYDGGSDSWSGIPGESPKNPCDAAKLITTDSKDSKYLSAKSSILAANATLEHSITLGKDVSNQITHAPMNNGGTNDVKVNETWAGAFASLHNHPNNTPLSTGDIYNAVTLNNKNSNFTTSFVLIDGETYAIVVTNLVEANAFVKAYPADENPPYPPEFPDAIFNEILEVRSKLGESIEARTSAIAFALNSHNSGISLMKQDNNGEFYPLIIKKTTQNGTDTYNLTSCNN